MRTQLLGRVALTVAMTESLLLGSSCTSAISPRDAPAGYYVLPADRVTLWQPGVTYNGGIPFRPQYGPVLTPSGDDDTATIQAALDACPAGSAVVLGQGTFHISGDGGLFLAKSHVTLRGQARARSASGASALRRGHAQHPFTLSERLRRVGLARPLCRSPAARSRRFPKTGRSYS